MAPISQLRLYALAFVGGALLALMISCTSLLAHTTTPLYASFIVHAGGSMVALVIVLITSRALQAPNSGKPAKAKPPLWMYVAGVVGAITVILPAISINGGVSLAGTIALALIGQIVFGIASDHFGLFGSQRRKVSSSDLFVTLLVLGGSTMIIFGKN